MTGALAQVGGREIPEISRVSGCGTNPPRSRRGPYSGASIANLSVSLTVTARLVEDSTLTVFVPLFLRMDGEVIQTLWPSLQESVDRARVLLYQVRC